MRKFITGLSLLFVLSMAACSCTLEKQAVDQLETNLKKQQADHKALMQKVNRPADEQKDWDKHYEATFNLISGLKKSTE